MSEPYASAAFSRTALRGRVAVVTGAQQGIGATVAEAFAAAGAAVALNYLDEPGATEALRDRIVAAGGSALAVRADVSRLDEIAALMDQAASRFGRVDILVNNAGIYPRSPALTLAEAEWNSVIDVNLKGSFFCAQAAARRMKAQGSGGAIVSMSSISIRGAANGAHYTASKGGITTMTRTLALEWAEFGIRVNAIAPGLVDTAQPRIASSDAEIAARGRATPLGRIGRVTDIADTALYLASDAASYVTGQVLHVNGGAFMP